MSADPMPPPNALRCNSGWQRTGALAFRPNWRGRPVLMAEERMWAWRPVCTGYSPANWQAVTRWRRAGWSEAVSVLPPPA